jgi:hypothetical protein
LAVELLLGCKAMQRTEEEEIKITAERLLVFIDDTGHETYKGHNYYALGGCVVLGAGYAWLKRQRRTVRGAINGDPDKPLHAADMERKPENSGVLAKFFLDPSFARIAAASTRKTPYPRDMHPAAPVMGTLEQQINGLANLLPCDGVAIIVETSQRADPVLKQNFGELKSEVVQSAHPTEYFLMPKRSAEPGLEVADFIISAAGSQVGTAHRRRQERILPRLQGCIRPAAARRLPVRLRYGGREQSRDRPDADASYPARGEIFSVMNARHNGGYRDAL